MLDRKRGSHVLILTIATVASAGLAACGDRSTPQPSFGYNDRWAAPAFRPKADSARSPIRLAEEDGVTVVRYGVNWDEIGPAASDTTAPCAQRLGWSSLDTAYENLTGIGACENPPAEYEPPIRPLLYVRGAPRPYARWWNRQAGTCTSTTDPSTPGDLITPVLADTAPANAAWQSFVQNVADRYPMAQGIEIWNEPNLRKYWGNCPVSATRYAELLDLAHKGITQSAHPGVPIVLAGLAPVEDDTDANWLTYLRDVFDAPGLSAPAPSLFDRMGLHPYRSAQDADRHPEWTFGRVAGQDVQVARAFLAQRGATRKPVWVTEVGVTTGKSANHNVADEDEQATALRGIYETLRDQDVPVVVIHRFADVSPNAESGEDPGYGVVRRPPGFDRKPAYSCLAQARGPDGSCPP